MKKYIRHILIGLIILLPLFIGLPSARLATNGPRQFTPTGLPSEARQFDFWLGRWNVAIPGINFPVQDVITSFGLGGGIAILEDFRAGAQPIGTSISLYSPKTGKWYQTWYDTDQLLIEMAGGVQDGNMIIQGPHFGTATGERLLGRITFSRITAQNLDFLYEVSTDKGKTWQLSLSSRFTRMPGTLPPPAGGLGVLGAELKARSGTFVPSVLPSGFRQFDFSVGAWNVVMSDRAGTSTAKISNFGLGGGIAVLEEFEGPDGYVDTSVSLYNNENKLWRQIRLDSNGRHLELVGEVKDGKAVLTGDMLDSQTGNTVLVRMTSDGVTPFGFKRTFEVSQDSGATWTLQSTAEFIKSGNPVPDFDLSASPETQTVMAGGSIGFTATVTGKDGFSQPVLVTATVSPATDTMKASVSPGPVVPGGMVDVIVTTTSLTPPGNYLVQVVGEAGSRKRSRAVVLTVNPGSSNPPSVTPIADQTVAPGEEHLVPVMASDAGSTSGLRLSASGPAYVTFTDNGNGAGVLRIAPSATETQGGRVVVTATNAAGLTAQTSFSVTIQAPDSQNPVVSNLALSKSKVKRKKDPTLQITWTSSDNTAVASQSIAYAGEGENFALTVIEGLAGDTTSFTWTVPASLGKTKTGRIKVTARDTAGNLGDAISPLFTIK
ncbi:MAG: hypothetical protein HY774_07590 [Acidobacteria bacterium]|nr:hypothetical protein [Acidobacteriota bacterium]